MSDSSKRDARSRIMEALRCDLLGPSDPDEVIQEYPTTRYIVGRLAPATDEAGENVTFEEVDGQVDSLENDTLGAGADDEEDSAGDFQPPLIVGFHPSSFGLSFLIEPDTTSLNVEVTWGDYRRESDEEFNGKHWRRYDRRILVQGVPVSKTGSIQRIPLTAKAAPSGVTVAGTEDGDLTLEGVLHDINGERAVSLFLVNRRTRGKVTDRSKDERWILQPRLRVSAPGDEAVFRAKRFDVDEGAGIGDDEVAIGNLLYQHAQEFATGHGVAVGWDGLTEDGARVSSVFTDFIPDFEVPNLIAPADATGGAQLDMFELSQANSPAQLKTWLEPMLNAYDRWIDNRKTEALTPPISGSDEYTDTANELIRRCEHAAERMSAGLDLLVRDPLVFEAFKFANQVMWDQRIHSIWAAANRQNGKVNGAADDFDIPKNRTWRPFQLGFILLNLRGLAQENSGDRRLVDLLWFPTGGGKTEAYLGLAAFVLAYRRLRGDRDGKVAGAGINVIMRYTLRLLTVQQFQRATALIASCEVVRRGDEKRWGREPFQIGLWVGRSTTPNTFSDSMSALEDINEGKKPKEGSPVQLLTCPRCGAKMVNDKGRPLKKTYLPDTRAKRTRVYCTNSRSCEFFAGSHGVEGIPVVVVDEEIYRACPSLLVATVDKFARMPFKGETQTLFGFRNRYSATYGHIAEAHGDKVSGLKVRDGKATPPLLPPELIIQDELHLISGPLGTMVGLYETAIDFLSRVRHESGLSVPAKVIASTATIRRARQQVRQLYDRDLVIFPPSGLSACDSFFAKELPINETNDATAGRLYVGVNAPGSSSKTLLVRVYAALLAAAQAEFEVDPDPADPYGTLVGYFNSLRALGGAKRLVEDDIKNVRLKYLRNQRGFPNRFINDPEELTSRLDSWKIPSLLKKLDVRFPREKGRAHPVDVLLATNMISVGVDINRLGLMAVTGQPKTTAEYIQATSRVGRKHPGLVVTMYNWMGPRDLSHYERFRSYHAALYRYVEAISVTPFSSRALDRGLRGMFASIERLSGPNMALQPQAQCFDPASTHTAAVIDDIVTRAAALVGTGNAQLVRERLLSHRDEWAKLTADDLCYSWLFNNRPPNNSRVLLKTAGTENEGEWSTPGSLREVEPTAAFYLSEEEG